MKEMALMDPSISANPTTGSSAAAEDSQPVTNGDISISVVPKNGEAVDELAQKPKRTRRTNPGVRRKRQKKLPPFEDTPEGTHHLAEDCEFPLDQCKQHFHINSSASET